MTNDNRAAPAGSGARDPSDRPPQRSEVEPLAYSRAARRFHWWTALIILILAPLGFAMRRRGVEFNIWDQVTNNMYSTHKVLGMVLLLIVLCRIGYRLTQGAPADEPTLAGWQRVISNITHVALYALLLLVPLLGWIGVQLFPALNVFGLFDLPAVVAPDKSMADAVLKAHGAAAIALLFLIGLHVLASLYHYVIRKDGVVNRMWVSLPRRGGG